MEYLVYHHPIVKCAFMKYFGILLIVSAMLCPTQYSISNKINAPTDRKAFEELNELRQIIPLKYKEDIIIEEAKEDLAPSQPIPEFDIVEEPEVVEEIQIVFPNIETHFVGGDSLLREFLRSNLRYPELSREMNIQGTVYIRFSIDKDGSVEKIKVLRGVDKSLDREAVRVIKRMPKWIPGESRGKKIVSDVTLPISFKIN
jgi:TonB family protein